MRRDYKLICILERLYCEFREEGDGLYYELYEFHEFIRLTSALLFV